MLNTDFQSIAIDSKKMNWFSLTLVVFAGFTVFEN